MWEANQNAWSWMATPEKKEKGDRMETNENGSGLWSLACVIVLVPLAFFRKEKGYGDENAVLWTRRYQFLLNTMQCVINFLDIIIELPYIPAIVGNKDNAYNCKCSDYQTNDKGNSILFCWFGIWVCRRKKKEKIWSWQIQGRMKLAV